MKAGQRFLYEKAEQLTRDLATEIVDVATETRGSIQGLQIFFSARAETISEVLQAISILSTSTWVEGETEVKK